jgi:hypothetical protein
MVWVGNDRAILRDSRCLGYLPDRVEDGEDFRDELLKAEDHLCRLTQNLRHGEFDRSEGAFRSVITREALGLAGTMVHILDMVGVDVVRQVRVPTYNRHFDEDREDELLESLATGVAIQSKYGESTAYRQLFETREEKRESSIEPTVDAEDPFGELIGKFTVVGDFRGKLDGFTNRLRDRLSFSEDDLAPDAPEFMIRVPVRSSEEFDRPVFARTVERMASGKNLSPTRDAVSVFRLFTETPHDVAAALCGLDSEDRERDVRLGEARYALDRVSEARVVPWASRGVQAIVSTLLAASEPLSVGELVDRADVSGQTWRNHRDRLVALDLVRETDEGVRLVLPFHGDESERHAGIQPWYTREDSERDDLREASVGGVVVDLLDELTPPEETLSRVSTALYGGPPDPGEIAAAWPWLESWLPTLRIVVREEMPEWGETERQEQQGPVVFGKTPGQTSIQEATA